MPNDGPRLLAAYRAMDLALVRAGWHATSEAWMGALESFWLSGATRMVIRKGRQAGGSTTMARVAVATGLFGDHRIAPGSRLAIPFVSIKLQEARERLYNIGCILGALGVEHRQTNDAIESTDAEHPPIVFQTQACSARTAVGLTAPAAVEDEVARWTNDDGSANPAEEVDAAIVPALATQPNARIYTLSSPLGVDDFHARLMARGDTADQRTFTGPSWFWNPGILEEDTRRLQADERIWQREFNAVPQAGRLGAFDIEAVDRAIAHPRHDGLRQRASVIVDIASGRHDAFVVGVARWVVPPKAATWPAYIAFERIEAIASGSFWKTMSAEQAADRVAQIAKEAGASDVFGDQREAFAFRSIFEARNLRFLEYPWTSKSKVQAVERVRRWLADGVIALPDNDQLRTELLNFQETITSSGAISFAGRGSTADDHVAILITAALAEMDGPLACADTADQPLIVIPTGRFASPQHDPWLRSLRSY